MKNLVLSLTIGSLFISGAWAKTERVYFGTRNAEGIYAANFDSETGTLSPLQLAVKTDHCGFIAISPDQQFLFRTGVAAYKINADSTLSLLSEKTTGEDNSVQVSVDRTGGMLMTAYYGSGCVAAWKVNPDGTLSDHGSLHRHAGSGEHPKRQTQPHAHAIISNPANTYAYAADLGIDKIMIYKMDLAAGTLAPAGEVVVPGGAMGPRHMKFDAAGKILYLLNELDLSVSIFQATENGQLTFLKSVAALPPEADKAAITAAEIRIHPNGRFVYASFRDLAGKGRDCISVLSCTETGLERIATTPAEVSVPRNFNLDPSGQWMLVGGQKSCDIAIFKIDPGTGKLTFTGEPVSFPGSPLCIEFLD
jgi:6-phosphogluconolactonase